MRCRRWALRSSAWAKASMRPRQQANCNFTFSRRLRSLRGRGFRSVDARVWRVRRRRASDWVGLLRNVPLDTAHQCGWPETRPRRAASWRLGINNQTLAACSENHRGSGLTFAPFLLCRQHRWRVSINHLIMGQSLRSTILTTKERVRCDGSLLRLRTQLNRCRLRCRWRRPDRRSLIS